MAEASGTYQFRDDQRPAVPGAPYNPPISGRLTAAYVLNAILIVLLATFGQGLYGTNLSAVAGGYGVTSAEATWLSAIYAGFAASNALFLIKGRQQFGIMAVATLLLLLASAASFVVLIAPGFATALLGRAANGLVASTMTAAAVYYLMIALPPDKRPAAIPIVLGTLQLGTPLARMVPVEVVTANGNVGLHLLNLAVPLLQLVLMQAIPLPPTPTTRVFRRLDALTVALFTPAIILLASVLALGRTHWWSDTPWLAWMLVLAVPLFAAGVLLEYSRTQPTLSIDWLSNWDILRFALIVIFERIAVSEQSVGAVALFQTAGLNNDQLHGLYLATMAAQVIGILLVVATLSERSIPYQALAALLMIAAGAWIDSFSNGLSRPQDLVFSQILVAAGTTVFIGPALLWIALRMLKTGGQYLVTMVVVFSLTQNVGSLIGSALLTSVQYASAAVHGSSIAAEITVGDPLVQDRVREEAIAAAPATPGTPEAIAAGTVRLGQSAGGQAAILGLLDAFRLVAAAAVVGALLIMLAIGRTLLMRRKEATA